MLQQPVNPNSSIENLLPSIRKQFATLHDERVNYFAAPVSIFVFMRYICVAKVLFMLKVCLVLIRCVKV